MKLIREHINEKFTQESDPISDLNIGLAAEIDKWIKTTNEYKDSYTSKDHQLWICSKYNQVDFVRYLLDKGADVHVRDDAALRWASRYGYDKVVKLLLDAGANVHANNDYALRSASERGHDKVVKLLLDAGADVHAHYDAALRLASYYGHDKVVKLLKDHIAKEKKIVKENLNEKFTQDSDPIKDLNIGIDAERFKQHSLMYNYTAVDDNELRILKKFFKTSKDKIFYIGNSDSKYAKKVEKIVSLKSTMLIFEKKFKDTNNFFMSDNIKCYESKYGKFAISEVDIERRNMRTARHLKWYLCDVSFAAYLDYKYKAFN